MEWLTVGQYAKRYGQSPGHVRRLIRQGKLDAFKPAGSGTWRVALQEKDSLTLGDDRAHQDVIADLLESALLEVRLVLERFPAVYDFSYRPDDPSNSLHRVTEAHTRRVELGFRVERESGWLYAKQHLASGLPNADKAWREIKTSVGEYWEKISERESDYIREAQRCLDEEGRAGSPLDVSRFYRSILSEVDKPHSIPAEEDYEIRPLQGRSLVTCEGSGIVSTETTPEALTWQARHLGWRRNFVNVHKPGLVLLREGAIAAADSFIETVEDVLVRGRVPGGCQRCPADRRSGLGQ